MNEAKRIERHIWQVVELVSGHVVREFSDHGMALKCAANANRGKRHYSWAEDVFYAVAQRF